MKNKYDFDELLIRVEIGLFGIILILILIYFTI